MDTEASESLNFIFWFFILLLAISVYCLLTTIKKALKITGKFNQIEFSLEKLDERNLNLFLDSMAVEKENRLKEKL